MQNLSFNKTFLIPFIISIFILILFSFYSPLKGQVSCQNGAECQPLQNKQDSNDQKIIKNLAEKSVQCLMQENKLCVQETFFDLGDIYRQISNYQESIRYYKESLNFAQAGVPESEKIQGRTLINLGYVNLLIGEYKQSLEDSNKGLEYSQKNHDSLGETVGLTNLGSAYDRTCQYKDSLENHERSKQIAEQNNYRKQMGDVYGNLGNLKQTLGYPLLALEYHQKNLEIAQEFAQKDPSFQKDVANALGNIGAAYYDLANYKEAENYYQQRLELAKKINDAQGIAKGTSDLGSVYYKYGEFKKAITAHQQYLDWAKNKENNDLQGQVNSLISLAMDYNALGQPEESFKRIEEALRIAKLIGDCQNEANALNVTGLAYQELGVTYQNSSFFEKAKNYFKDSIRKSQEYNNEWSISHATGNLGSTYLIWGKYDNNPEYFQKAIENYQIKLQILKKYNNIDLRSQGAVLANIGIAQTYLGNYEEANKKLTQARNILQSIGDLDAYANSLAATAYLDNKKGNINLAIDTYQQAIEIKESIRSNLNVGAYKMSFEAQQINTYENLIELLWEQGKKEESFQFVERAKAKTLFDQLAAAKVGFRHEVDSNLLKKQQDLQAEIIARREELISLKNLPEQEQDQNKIRDLENEIKNNLTPERRKILEQIKVQDPETAYLLSPDAEKLLPLDKIQQKLDEQTTLLEYFITDNRTFAFIITHNNFFAIELKDSQNNLLSRQKITQTIIEISPPSTTNDPPSQELQKGLQTLHELLILPLQNQGYLKTPKLIIVPHGKLHALSFAALHYGNKDLIDDFTSLSILPNANLLQFIKYKKTPTKQVLILAKPSVDESLHEKVSETFSFLQFAEEEAKEIANIYGQKVYYINDKATDTLIYQKGKDADIIHIAAHGTYNTNEPLFSKLYLARDKRDKSDNAGQLTVQEIYSIDLTKTTKLVVLSACETNVGKATRGDEIIGLNRAFIYAGSPTVIASLWSVPDEATSKLMIQFHQNMRKYGMNKAQALIEAQKTVRKEYPHPFYWAAFTLTGDGGKL